MGDTRIDRMLQENRERILRLAGQRGARNVRVFGSVARGEAGERSDVDFLIDPEPGYTLLSQAALVRELESLLGRPVEVASARGLRQSILEHVLREAVPL